MTAELSMPMPSSMKEQPIGMPVQGKLLKENNGENIKLAVDITANNASWRVIEESEDKCSVCPPGAFSSRATG